MYDYLYLAKYKDKQTNFRNCFSFCRTVERVFAVRKTSCFIVRGRLIY